MLLSCGGLPEESEPIRSSAASLTVDQACEALRALKAANPLDQIGCDETLQEKYRELLAQCSGISPDQFEVEITDSIAAHPVTPGLSPGQLSAWQGLAMASRGRLELSWSNALHTPTTLTPWITLWGADTDAARADFDARVAPAVWQLLGGSASDELVLQHDLAGDSDPAMDAGSVVRSWHYLRVHQGLPVWGDHVGIFLRTSDWCASGWWAAVEAHWARDLPPALPVPPTPPGEAVAAAQAAGHLAAGVAAAAPELGYYTRVDPPALAWSVLLENGEGERWHFLVSAADGQVLAAADQVMHASGSLKLYVGRPYDESNKVPRALPSAYLYEDNWSSLQSVTCSLDTQQQQAGAMPVLGTTSYSDGSYVNLTPSDPGDTYWQVDYRGLWAQDRSPVDVLDIGFPAGTSYTFPQQTLYQRSRRGEAYYLLSYGAATYSAYGTLPQYVPLSFNYELSGAGECTEAPWSWHQCCNGSSGHGCINLWCSSGLGISALPSVERHFRWVVLHEQNHSLSYKARRYPNQVCGEGGAGECGFWEEGRADYAAMALSRFEGRYDEYPGTGLTYPDANSRIFYSDLMATYHHKAGAYQAIQNLNFNLGSYFEGFVLIGACSDANADGYTQVQECEPNSFYRRLLWADSMLYSGKSQTRHEISAGFHEHVTDAVPGPPIEQFPWADEMPNRTKGPPFVAVELGDPVTIIAGPAPGSGALKFERSDDYDTVAFYGRAGERYYIETRNLQSGVDTVLEVLERNMLGDEVVISQNDDCNSFSLRSCLTFTPAFGGIYRVRVHPAPASVVGPFATYELRIRPLDDDYPDTIPGAAALSANGVSRNGDLETSTDVDVFKVTSGTSQTLYYRGCSTTLLSLRVEVLDASGTVIATSKGTGCLGLYHTVNVSAGDSYLRVSSSAAGSYSLKALLGQDIDVDSTAAHAWPLGDGVYPWALLGGRFETAADSADWYRITVEQDFTWLVLETFGAETRLELYTPSGTLYGRSGSGDALPDESGGNGLGQWMVSDSGGAIASPGSRLSFQAPVVGTYHLRVLNTNAAAGAYQLFFYDAGPTRGIDPPP